MSNYIDPNWKMSTLVCHGAGGSDPATGAHCKPIYQTSTFAFRDADHGENLFTGKEKGFIYSRLGNPTIEGLEHEITCLESGVAGLAFGSGMAAVSAVILGICGAGENYITTVPIYGGTHTLGQSILPRFNIENREVNCSDLAALEAAIDENTRLIMIETPANPTIRLVDIEECVKIARRHNVVLAIDNTFATPYLQNPLKMGADIVLHSATKYISGHGDTVAGLVVCSTEELKLKIQPIQHDIGGVISPFNAFLLLRGLKTLAVRMDRHCMNALKVAQYLSFHPKVAEVWYPGLSTHPDHELAKKQMRDFGGMVSFILKGGRSAGKTVLNNVKLAVNAVSLGDTDTLIVHPATTTHSSYSPEALKLAGMDEGLVRLSVGIEDYHDIIDDLSQALKQV